MWILSYLYHVVLIPLEFLGVTNCHLLMWTNVNHWFSSFYKREIFTIGISIYFSLSFKSNIVATSFKVGVFWNSSHKCLFIYNLFWFLLKIFGCLHKHGLICLHQMKLQYEKFERSVLKFFESHYQFQWAIVAQVHLRGPWSTTIVDGIHIMCFSLVVSFTFEYLKTQF